VFAVAGAVFGGGAAAALRSSTRSPAMHLSPVKKVSAHATERSGVIMMADGDKLTGTCKWFDSVKGFGFIEVEGDENDYFVHQSDIYAPGYRSLAEGEPVEFTVTTDDRSGKTKAVDVTGPNGEYVQGQPREEYDDDGY
jgi:VCBS repeat-containing protein